MNETPLPPIPLRGNGTKANSIYRSRYFRVPCVIDNHVYELSNISSVPWSNLNFTNTYIGGENLTIPVSCAYDIADDYATAISLFMNQTLLGTCSAAGGMRLDLPMKTEAWNEAVCKPWYIKSLVNKGNASFSSIDAIPAIFLLGCRTTREAGSLSVKKL